MNTFEITKPITKPIPKVDPSPIKPKRKQKPFLPNIEPGIQPRPKA